MTDSSVRNGWLKPGGRPYRLLQWGFFPVAVVGAPWAVHLLIDAGVHFALATYSVVAGLALLMFALEHWMPFRAPWNRLQGDLANDVISGSVAYLLVPKLLGPVYLAALAGAAAWLSAAVGGELWPLHWPLWLQLVALLLVGDAGRYWGHRLAHEWPLLWRFHAVHHSAERLWFFNATRQHPVDKAWFMFTELFFPILLGVSGEVLSLYFAVTAVCGFTQHCNIDLKLGWLYRIFNVADLHRWHHSKKIEESDHNYGNNLIVYDLIFGTCYHPGATGDTRQVETIGLQNPDYPRNYLGQFLAPFRRGRLDKLPPAADSDAPVANPKAQLPAAAGQETS